MSSWVKVFLALFALLFIYSGLFLLLLSPYLGAPNMVVREVALLAHSHRVEKPVGMAALSCIDLTAEALIARRTHVFGVMLSVGMGAVRDGLWLVFGLHLLGSRRFVGAALLLIRGEVSYQALCRVFVNRHYPAGVHPIRFLLCGSKLVLVRYFISDEIF